MKYASAVVACTAILSAATALAAPHSLKTERSFNNVDLEVRAPEPGKPDTKPAPRPPAEEDPRLQFIGGKIPGERKKSVEQQGTTVKTEKRSIYDLYLEARGNVLSKPVKEEKPIKTNKRSIDDFNLEARGNVLSKPVRESTPIKTDKRSIDDFYLDARGNVLSKPVKEERPVKTNKRSFDDMYLEARSPETGSKAIPKPQPQPIVPKPEDDPRLKFIGGKIPGERVRTRSSNDLDLESRQYIENLAEMFERALEEREVVGFDDLD